MTTRICHHDTLTDMFTRTFGLASPTQIYEPGQLCCPGKTYRKLAAAAPHDAGATDPGSGAGVVLSSVTAT